MHKELCSNSTAYCNRNNFFKLIILISFHENFILSLLITIKTVLFCINSQTKTQSERKQPNKPKLLESKSFTFQSDKFALVVVSDIETQSKLLLSVH